MSTKKTTTAKAPAKTAAKAPDKKPAAKAPAKEAPKAKPTPKAAPAKAPAAKDILTTLFEGLPEDPKACTVEQVKLLQSRYSPIKDTLTDEIRLKVREYGTAATKAAAAKPAVKQEPTDKEIEALAKEMSDVMDLEPVIEFGVPDTLNRIRAEAKDLRPSDFDSISPKCFTVHARATFKKLGIALPGEKAAKAKAPKVPGKKGGTPRTRDGAPCSKTVVYLAWKKGQTDVDKLMSLPGQNAALITVRGWLSAWKNGKNLPAVAAQTGK